MQKLAYKSHFYYSSNKHMTIQSVQYVIANK